MTRPRQSRDQRFGLMVTIAGALMFVPDTLIVRLIAANTMDVAILRALFACAATVIGIALCARHTMPSRAEFFTWTTALFIFLHGFGTVLFMGALGNTSVANTLLISATSPFLAALMSFFVLGERIEHMTAYGIFAVFAGVGIIASGSLGGGGLFGDLLALANAACSAAYYVVLRHTASRSQIVPSTLGFLVTVVVAWPLAPHLALTAYQVGLIAISGGVILTVGSALLIIGPRYIPAPEVTMIIMLESVAAPVLVWLVLGENPGVRSIIGGGVIFAALVVHSVWRWRKSAPPEPVAAKV